MYSFRYDNKILKSLNRLDSSKNSESLENKLKGLANNPHKIAKTVNEFIPCDYYINCTRHSILFDINDEKKEVVLYTIIRSALLNKILKGWDSYKSHLN